VVPTLKNASTPIPGVRATTTPDAPTPPSATGESYEFGLLTSVTTSSAVASNLENLIGAAYTAYEKGSKLTMDADLTAFLAYVQFERGRQIPAGVANDLTLMGGLLVAGLGL
jgi:hypothetical protein